MREKIRLFLSLVGIDKIPSMIASGHMLQIYETAGMPPGAELEGPPGEALRTIEKAFGDRTRELLDQMMVVYEETFTEGELDQMIAFYQSPVGQKIVDIGGLTPPAIAQAADAWTESTMKAVTPQLEAILNIPTADAPPPSP